MSWSRAIAKHVVDWYLWTWNGMCLSLDRVFYRITGWFS